MKISDSKPEDIATTPHRRLNILTGEWVLVSPHRSNRPWQGQLESADREVKQQYDKDCYLCPSNRRVSGEVNHDYNSVYVFDNDHAALFPESEPFHKTVGGLLEAKSETGKCRVICFSPRHDLTLAEMNVNDIEKVVHCWRDESDLLSKDKTIKHVQIFENKGSVMGCSNPHPHGQIWAQNSIPTESSKEISQMMDYAQKNENRALLIDYLELELKLKERIVSENDHFVVLVPYWATWPFETLILPRKQCSKLEDLSPEQCYSFADIIKRITVKYDNVFETSFPYSSGIHQSPFNSEAIENFTLHMHFYPPLLRSATIKKFMVGYEMLAESQRDITAEQSAKMLRDCSDIHYLNRTE